MAKVLYTTERNVNSNGLSVNILPYIKTMPYIFYKNSVLLGCVWKSSFIHFDWHFIKIHTDKLGLKILSLSGMKFGLIPVSNNIMSFARIVFVIVVTGVWVRNITIYKVANLTKLNKIIKLYTIVSTCDWRKLYFIFNHILESNPGSIKMFFVKRVQHKTYKKFQILATILDQAPS